MPEPTPIERAYELIQGGKLDDARRALADIIQANSQDAMAWALSARLAPDRDRCAYALRQVVDRSTDNELAQWAIHQLERVQTSGQMDATPPPLLGIAAGQSDALQEVFRQSARTPSNQQAHEPKSASAPAPLKLSKPLPGEDARAPQEGGLPRTIREAGGAVMILGVLEIVVAIVSPPVFQAISRAGILPGWIGISLIVVGGLLIAVGYISGG